MKLKSFGGLVKELKFPHIYKKNNIYHKERTQIFCFGIPVIFGGGSVPQLFLPFEKTLKRKSGHNFAF